eukprot:gene46363-57812_t
MSCVGVSVEGGHLAVARTLLEASCDIYGDHGLVPYSTALLLMDDILTHPEVSMGVPMAPLATSTTSHSRRPVSIEIERETVVRSRSGSHVDKVREKGGLQSGQEEKEEEEEEECVEEGVVASDRLSLCAPNVDEHAERLTALRVALTACKSPSGGAGDDSGEGSQGGRVQEEEDEADHHEYMFALSALAVRALGDSSAAASRST